MRRYGAPVLDLVGRRPFLEQQSMLDGGFPHGVWVYMKACDVPGLSDDVIDLSIDPDNVFHLNQNVPLAA